MYNMNIHLHPCMTTVQNYAQTSVKKIQEISFKKLYMKINNISLRNNFFSPFLCVEFQA